MLIQLASRSLEGMTRNTEVVLCALELLAIMVIGCVVRIMVGMGDEYASMVAALDVSEACKFCE
jgi:hypothetical protein